MLSACTNSRDSTASNVIKVRYLWKGLGLGWVPIKGFSPRGWPSTGTGAVVRTPSPTELRKYLDNTLGHRVGLLGCPAHGQELDLMVLMSPYQHSTFCDSMKHQYQHKPGAPQQGLAAAVPRPPKVQRALGCTATNQRQYTPRAGRSCACLHLTAQAIPVVFGTGGLKANNAAADGYFPPAFGRLQEEQRGRGRAGSAAMAAACRDLTALARGPCSSSGVAL